MLYFQVFRVFAGTELICTGINEDPLSDEHKREAHWICRGRDWTWSFAQEVANAATTFMRELYVAVDSGPNVSPRFDVIKAPRVGDDVSYGFNGDYYPDGKIVKVSKSLMVTTSTGNVYRRRGKSGSWKMAGGTWSLVPGHRNDKNPCF